MMSNPFTFWVPGRPAPQGSKDANGREVSKYLPAWQAAIKKAVLERMRELGIGPLERPVLRGPLGFSATYHMGPDQPIDGKPDLDKLVRGTWDPLCQLCARLQGGRGAWLIEDDSKFVVITNVREVRAVNGRTGADIVVWQENMESSDGK